MFDSLLYELFDGAATFGAKRVDRTQVFVRTMRAIDLVQLHPMTGAELDVRRHAQRVVSELTIPTGTKHMLSLRLGIVKAFLLP